MLRVSSQSPVSPTAPHARWATDIRTGEAQHLRYLDALLHGEPVSRRLENSQLARAELLTVYMPDYIDSQTTLDLDDQIEMFNNASAFRRCLFVDWYAISDYGEAGYVGINRLVRDYPEGAFDNAVVVQLTRALMHQIMVEKANNTHHCDDMLYRGETRKLADMLEIEEGTNITFHAFTSASGSDDVAHSFRAELEYLGPDVINVLYEIERTTALAGPNITDLLRDGEEEVVFLPFSRFTVTDVAYSEATRSMTIGLRTCDVDMHEWDQQLASLF
ncbi:hypothetical protein [Cupriavidus sp. RAF12]|uniref:hypothetical protein n=1 Tax=Cupriavidus sp. RAF12 TaxID=3233050 RepID=UPI003F9022DE